MRRSGHPHDWTFHSAMKMSTQAIITA